MKIENNSQVIFENYITKQPNYIHNLMRGIEILKALQNNSCESYIIGQAVRDLVLGLPIHEVTIYTTASYPQLSQICQNIKHDSVSYFFTEGDCEYKFYKLQEGKTHLQCFDRRLAYIVDQIPFNFESLILSQAQIINDLTEGYQDLQNKVIRTHKNPVHVIKNNPKVILDAMVSMAKYHFTLNSKLKRAIINHKKLLTNISDELMVDFIYELFQCEDYNLVLNFIDDYNIFKKCPIYREYFEKIIDNKRLPFEQKILFIYLYLNKIPNRDKLLEGQLEDFEQKMVITNHLLDSKITDMLVYNIGEKTLCECDEIACLYNRKYHSQKKQISKINKSLEITNIRELNITKLEIVKLLDGDRSLKSKIIFNMLLEKVINHEIVNHSVVLKQEVMNINQTMKDTFNYVDPSWNRDINITNEYLENLLNKYNKDLRFLIDVYLNDEKELYNLSVQERREKHNQAKLHAREFLLQTNQYKILEERNLI